MIPRGAEGVNQAAKNLQPLPGKNLTKAEQMRLKLSQKRQHDGAEALGMKAQTYDTPYDMNAQARLTSDNLKNLQEQERHRAKPTHPYNSDSPRYKAGAAPQDYHGQPQVIQMERTPGSRNDRYQVHQPSALTPNEYGSQQMKKVESTRVLAREEPD